MAAVRMRAFVMAVLSAPLLGGCLIYYLATDPYEDGSGDGHVGGSDGGTSGDADVNDATSIEDGGCFDGSCIACSPACLDKAACLGSNQCGDAVLSLPDSAQPVAIAAWDDALFVLTSNGSIYTCTGDCTSFTTVYVGDAGSGLPSGIYASDAGLFWAAPTFGIFQASLTGTNLRRLVNAPNAATVVASGTRVAWIEAPSGVETGGVYWSDQADSVFGGPGSVDGGVVHAIATSGAFTGDLGFVQGNKIVVWNDNTNGHLTTILPDAGIVDTEFATGAKSGSQISLASDGTVAALGWYHLADTTGELALAVPPYTSGFQPSVNIISLAQIYVRDGVIYYSEKNDAINVCDGSTCGGAKVRIPLDVKGLTIAQIAVTQSHVFFLGSASPNILYMVANPTP